MKTLSRAADKVEEPSDRYRSLITETEIHPPVNADAGIHKGSKIHTFLEVLRCEFAKPGRTSASSKNGLQPTKNWTPIYYAIYHNREAALLHFLRAGKLPDGVLNAQPLICVAVAAGHKQIVDILCQAGANVSAACKHNGETPLHLALKTGRNDILELLLPRAPDLNAQTSDTHETPFHYAARSAPLAVVEALLKDRMSCEARDKNGCTPAEVAIRNQNLKTATAIVRADRRNLPNLSRDKRLLLKHIGDPKNRSSIDPDLIADVLEVCHPRDSTALVEAVKMNDAAVVNTVLGRGASPGQATTSGVYPIFVALELANVPIVQALVENGADVTLRNAHGFNVLQAVLENPPAHHEDARSELFAMLLSRGADASVVYPDGSTLLHHAVTSSAKITKILLQKKVVNVDAQDQSGNTALHVAVTSPMCIASLLNEGASPDIVNKQGLTPLLHATRTASGDKEPDLECLITVSSIRQADAVGKTALHYAAQNGLVKAVQFLLQVRAETARIDSQQCTPLLLAVLNHQWAIVPLLVNQPGVNLRDTNGMTALHYIAMSSPDAKSTWSAIASAVAPFCGKGVSRSMRDESGSTPLICAVKTLPENGIAVIEALLVQKDSRRCNCVGHEDYEQRTALFYAVTLGKPLFVEVLLKHGAPFEIQDWTGKGAPTKPKDKRGKQALKLLAEHEWLRCMMQLKRQTYSPKDEPMFSKLLPIKDLAALLALGLDPNALPKGKPTSSLIWAVLDRTVQSLSTSADYFSEALELAVRYGADVNLITSRSPRRTSRLGFSQLASLTTHILSHILEQCPDVPIEVIVLLLENGAKLSLKSSLYDGRFPLHSAVRVNRVEVVELFAERRADLNTTDNKQRTPLIIAAENGNSETVDFLLDSGAKTNAQDGEGNTALHIAAEKGNAHIISALLNAGADARSTNKKGVLPARCVPKTLPETERQNISEIFQQAEKRDRRRTVPEKRTVSKKSVVSKPKETGQAKPKAPSSSADAPSSTSVVEPQQRVVSSPPVASPRPSRSVAFASMASKPKQMFSIQYTTPPVTPPKQHAVVTPPKTPVGDDQKAQRLQPRVDSGLELARMESQAKEAPVLDRKMKSFDGSETHDTNAEELESWLAVSKLMDRI